jgi:hypothetical protein
VIWFAYSLAPLDSQFPRLENRRLLFGELRKKLQEGVRHAAIMEEITDSNDPLFTGRSWPSGNGQKSGSVAASTHLIPFWDENPANHKQTRCLGEWMDKCSSVL